MVKIQFTIRDGHLVLRISENKDRFYKRVEHLLKGNPNIAKHWDKSRERFSNYAVSCTENNKILDAYKEQYLGIVREHPEYSAKQINNYYSKPQIAASGNNEKAQPITQYNLVEEYLQVVIEREKAKQGCNFETYYKLLSKCRKKLVGFSTLSFSELNFDTCIKIAKEFARYDGYKGTSKTFRNLLGKASKDNNVPFSISQIGEFRFADYDPQRNQVEKKSPDVLTPEQLTKFLNADMKQITPKYKDRKEVELYYDFCVFMFHSFFAPCDVIKLKTSDIKHDSIQVKRKKTHHTVIVPISTTIQLLIDKYKGISADGYVFPIMDDKKAKEYVTKDYLFKKFREKLNIWLKSVGKELGLTYNLYGYVFRHTAITTALDSGLPTSFVASIAGTSIEMIEEHYYNGSNNNNYDKLKSAFSQAYN